MGAGNSITNDFEIFMNNVKNQVSSPNISVIQFHYQQLLQHLKTSIYLKSSLFILVLSGKGKIEINFKENQVGANDIILLSFGHFFKIIEMDSDFKCFTLYISKDYINEMYSADMIYKRIKYGVKMHRTPLLNLKENEAYLLTRRMLFIDEVIEEPAHLYYQEMILNALLTFFLDLSNIIEKDTVHLSNSVLSRDEIYFQKFLELLVDHYKEQHLVDYYADNLHITPHYLTLIVKRLSGQTVSDLIFQLIFSEAKLLLQQAELSIQQIAEQLYFSDQSAFGKFFKRNSGLSPKAYRSNSSLALLDVSNSRMSGK
ncbi:MAG TPA: helix-turn-helix transcriptional regulator [Daejeonella sp.]|nr:helix-turn-helix transcriptional regulator [Daejeonella sp.]